MQAGLLVCITKWLVQSTLLRFFSLKVYFSRNLSVYSVEDVQFNKATVNIEFLFSIFALLA